MWAPIFRNISSTVVPERGPEYWEPIVCVTVAVMEIRGIAWRSAIASKEWNERRDDEIRWPRKHRPVSNRFLSAAQPLRISWATAAETITDVFPVCRSPITSSR